MDEGISLLNLTTLESFQFILLKINSKEAFTDTDVEKLVETLNMSEIKVKQIIETVSYLQKHLSKVVLRPVELENALIKNFNIDEEKAHIWIKTWTEDISQNFNLESEFLT